jgi:hypothetical protein
VVSVYGDSLVWEARNALGQLLRASGPARIESFGGTALCDFSQEIVDNARSEPTRLVVIAFTGNTFTPCMKREGPSPSVAQWTAMYVADVNEVIGRLHELEVPVLLVGAPPSIDAADVTFWTPINAAWAGVAAQWRAVGADVSYADTGRVLADADGQWTATLPCLPTEGPERGCVEGLIPVRSPDRGHFCPQLGTPVNGAIQECAVWSGGAWRYALSIAGAVEQRL